jgi:parvulin-like peptidyl-prolyl isomerase
VWAGSVNDVEFSMGDLVSRIRVLQGVNRYQGGQVDLSTVPFEYLQNLINAEILRQASPELGIAPSDAEIDEELRRQYGPAVAPGQESDPGQLDREYRNNYQVFLTATGLSDGDYRIITEEQLSLRQLVAAMGQTIESPMEQVEVQWIRLPLARDAQSSGVQPEDVVRRLAIEDFGVVAREVSESGGFARADGYVGWVPRDTFPDLDQALYGDPDRGLTALAPGETSRPIFTSDAVYIIKVLSGPEIQELDPRVQIKLNIELVRQWQELQLKTGSENGAVRMNFNSKLYAWVADQVFVTAPRLPAEEAQPGQPGVPFR